MTAASSSDAPAATSRALAISISFSADTLGMDILPGFPAAGRLAQALASWPERQNRRSVAARTNQGRADHGKQVERLCRCGRLCRPSGSEGIGRGVHAAGGDRAVGACADRPGDLYGQHPPDQSERGVRRHRRRGVSQHRPRQVVPAHQLSGQGHPDLVVPGGCRRPQPGLCRRLADQHVSQRGLRRDLARAAQSRHAGPRGDAVRLPGDADGAASVASRARSSPRWRSTA